MEVAKYVAIRIIYNKFRAYTPGGAFPFAFNLKCNGKLHIVLKSATVGVAVGAAGFFHEIACSIIKIAVKVRGERIDINVHGTEVDGHSVFILLHFGQEYWF